MNKEYIKETYKNDEVELEVKVDLDYESVWLSQDDLSKLYKIERSWIGRIIRQSIKENDSICANLAQMVVKGRTYYKKHYSLEVIEKIGYKINVDITKDFINFSKNLLNELRNKNSEKWLPIEVFSDGDVRLEVRISPSEDTALLTSNQISVLYDTDNSSISRHIKSIFEDGELDNSVLAKIATTASDGKMYLMNYYNLDMILAIGYRVRSKKGIAFRKWASKTIKQYLMKGFVIDEKRVTQYNDNYKDLMENVISINNKVDNLDKRVTTLEDKNKDNKESIFFNGEFYDAHSCIIDIIRKADKEIILIDNYISIDTLNVLKYRKNKVKILIITRKDDIPNITKTSFIKQYNNIEIKHSDIFHDRFLIIDNIKLYHIGASLKDIGKKCFAISELNSDILEILSLKINKIVV